jgi:hypothetical protein
MLVGLSLVCGAHISPGTGERYRNLGSSRNESIWPTARSDVAGERAAIYGLDPVLPAVVVDPHPSLDRAQKRAPRLLVAPRKLAAAPLAAAFLHPWREEEELHLIAAVGHADRALVPVRRQLRQCVAAALPSDVATH